jgi:hypothetical protein
MVDMHGPLNQPLSSPATPPLELCMEVADIAEEAEMACSGNVLRCDAVLLQFVYLEGADAAEARCSKKKPHGTPTTLTYLPVQPPAI